MELFRVVERGVIVEGCCCEGFACGLESMAWEGGFEELLPAERKGVNCGVGLRVR